jgi:hypothetical protein
VSRTAVPIPLRTLPNETSARWHAKKQHAGGGERSEPQRRGVRPSKHPNEIRTRAGPFVASVAQRRDRVNRHCVD